MQPKNTAKNKPGPVLAKTSPEAAGLSSQRLQHLDRVLQEYVDQNYVPGAIALIARNGKIVYHQALGYNDRQARPEHHQDQAGGFRRSFFAARQIGCTSPGARLRLCCPSKI